MINTQGTLADIAAFVRAEPGLGANVIASEIEGGAQAAELMNQVIMTAIEATGVNDDGIITERDAEIISDYIRANPDLYAQFVEGHGNDEGGLETGFHLVQGDGGAYRFQGRNFVDTVADAIYHIGFEYENGRFLNEDGNANETVADVAGWLNYFVNGLNAVYGSTAGDNLHSGQYSFDLDDAANERFFGFGGDDTISAGDGRDTILAGDGDDRAWGHDGHDYLNGQTGDDSLSGDQGNDRLIGGLGNDYLHGGEGRDSLLGGSGDDRIVGAEGADRAQGGSGHDTIYMGTEDDRAFGQAGNDELGGGEGNDFLAGGDGSDRLYGDEGNDILRGDAGNDSLYGREDQDRLYGGLGDDSLSGGDGHDSLYGEAGADRLNGGAGNDVIRGGVGNDYVWGSDGDDVITGDAGRDTLEGAGGDDRISGGHGHDAVSGHDGNDWLRGDVGADTLWGGAGEDTLWGGAGADLLKGWESSEDQATDTFVFHAGDSGLTEETMDVIEGFVSGIDLLDLRPLGPLEFVNDEAFAGGGTGSVRFEDERLEIDIDGDGAADMAITIRWVDDLDRADFVFA